MASKTFKIKELGHKILRVGGGLEWAWFGVVGVASVGVAPFLLFFLPPAYQQGAECSQTRAILLTLLL